MTTKFQPLTSDESRALRRALTTNATGDVALLVGRDTGFDGMTHQEEIENAQVINAIKSQPCHYSDHFDKALARVWGPSELKGVYHSLREGKFLGVTVGRLGFGKISFIARDPSAVVGAVWVEYA